MGDRALPALTRRILLGSPTRRVPEDALTEEEIERLAREDPDNPPSTEEELARGVAARDVRLAREKTGLSQSQFAKRYRINLARLRDVEQGRTMPELGFPRLYPGHPPRAGSGRSRLERGLTSRPVMDLRQDLAFALMPAVREAAREAGRIACSYFRRGGKTTARVWSKHGGSPVTEADVAVDSFLKVRLIEALPDAAWLSEETTDDPARLGAPRLWIVDPIDGTRAFLSGHPDWSIAIALLVDGEPVLGIVHAPAPRPSLRGLPRRRRLPRRAPRSRPRREPSSPARGSPDRSR